LLPPDLAGKRVLDAGCGPGHYAEQLLDRGASVIACDVTPGMVELARNLVGHRGAEVVEHDLGRPLTWLNDGAVDVVLSALVLDYVAGTRRRRARPLDLFQEPHIPVFDKSERKDGTFSRDDFTYDRTGDVYVCPGGKQLQKYRRAFTTPRTAVAKDNTVRYRARKADCDACSLKPRCCLNAPARKVPRSIETARDKARTIAKTEAYIVSRRERKKVEMLFAHLKRILRLDRLRLRGPCGARDEFLLAATAQNLRKLAMLLPSAAPMMAA
jgi:SAM-dependent methyltransferase